MSETQAGGGRRLLNATAVMASGTAVSRVLGLVRAMLIAFVLGNATMRVDVFNVAMFVPNSLYVLLAGGTLNNVLVPQIVRAVNHDEDGGKAFIDRIITGFLIVLGALTVVFTVATPLVMSIYASRWNTPELADHWRSLLLLSYLTMPQLFFFGVFFLIGQVLNARETFGPMMWAPIVNNVVSIGVFGVYLWVWGTQTTPGTTFTDPQLWLLGLGSTLGIAAQTVVLLPYLKKAGFSYHPRFDLKGTGLGRTFHVAKWMVGYVALTSLAQVVMTNLATSGTASTDGASSGAGLTAYQNAYLIWILPHSLLTVSLATAMLPMASRYAAAGDRAGVAAETNRAIRLALTFLLPASVAFVALSDPITRVPFGMGVGANDYHFVAWALAAFGIGLVPYTIQYLYLRAYYALDNTKVPFLLQIWISGANAGLAVVLVLAWHSPETIAARLALAYSLAYVLGVFITHRSLRKRLPDLDGHATWHYLVRLFWATLPAAALAWVVTWWFAQYPSALLRIVGLALAGLLAVLAFFFAAKRLGIPEATELIGVLRRRKGDEGESDAVEAIVEESDQEADQRQPAQPVAAGVREERTNRHVGPPSPFAPPEDELNLDPDDEPSAASAGDGVGVLTRDASAARGVDGTGVFVPIASAPPPPEDVLDFPEPPATELQPTADASADPGRLLGERYRLEEQLAVRDRTQTWRAHDVVLGRPVLVQLLAANDPRTPEALRMAREWAAATDSRFLRVLDVVDSEPGAGAYLVYEYASGQSLEKVLQSGPLTGVETAWIVREVADAMTALHAQGLYHRHLSPATLLVTGSGNVKVLGSGTNGQTESRDGATADVQGLGRVLYACLVKRWPDGDDFGLPAAALVEGRLPSPAQVRSGVAPALDQVADRVLAGVPRGNATRITTAAELTTELSLVLGPMSAAADLSARLHPAETEPPPAAVSTIAPPVPTPVASRFSASARLPEPVADVDYDDDYGDETEPFVDSVLSRSESFTPVPPPPVPAEAEAEAPRRRVPRNSLLIGVIGLVLAVGLIAAMMLSTRSPQPQKAAAPVASAVQIAKADDFDPKADGGSGAENPKQAKLAIDGDPATTWTTERYRKLAALGGLKPGVGLVLDLGKERTLTQLTLELEGGGTDLEVRVPKDPGEDSPMKSNEQWTVVAATRDAAGRAQLDLPGSPKSRYWLVYLTSLPGVEDGYFRGGIAEIEALGY